MINFESQIYSKVKTALLGQSVTMKSIEDFTPTAFPTVCLYEDDNYTSTNHSTSSHSEKYANVLYVLNVYTNGSEKKKKGKALFDLADTAMQGLGFTRQTMTPVPNSNYYRITARYVATIGTDGTIYRR